MNIDIIEWSGCATGVAGSLLLASRHRYAGWGFVLYLFSNAFWITFGILHQNMPMIAMQSVFILTALYGIYNWLIRPREAPSEAPAVEGAPALHVVASANPGDKDIVQAPESHSKAA